MIRSSVAACCLAALACAQAPGAAEAAALARRLLGSNDRVERAWGAHWAGVSGDEALTPLLLRSWATSGNDLAVRRTIATALVEIRAQLPAAELQRLAGEFQVEAIVLAAHDPARYEDTLLTVIAHPNDALAWSAAAEMLRAIDSRAFTAELLHGLEQRLIIKVIHADQDHEVDESAAEYQQHRAIAVPAGFPQLDVVSLARGAGGGAPLVDGLDTVTVQRVPAPANESTQIVSLHRDPVATAMKRFAYLQDMLSADVRGFVEHSGHIVEWRDAAALLDQVDDLRLQRRRAWHTAVADLVAHRHLDPAAAQTLAPRIAIVLRDARPEGKPPLPPMPPAAGEQVRIGLIYWFTDYQRARAHAVLTDRPLLLHFGENPG